MGEQCPAPPEPQKKEVAPNDCDEGAKKTLHEGEFACECPTIDPETGEKAIVGMGEQCPVQKSKKKAKRKSKKKVVKKDKKKSKKKVVKKEKVAKKKDTIRTASCPEGSSVDFYVPQFGQTVESSCGLPKEEKVVVTQKKPTITRKGNPPDEDYLGNPIPTKPGENVYYDDPYHSQRIFWPNEEDKPEVGPNTRIYATGWEYNPKGNKEYKRNSINLPKKILNEFMVLKKHLIGKYKTYMFIEETYGHGVRKLGTVLKIMDADMEHKITKYLLKEMFKKGWTTLKLTGEGEIGEIRFIGISQGKQAEKYFKPEIDALLNELKGKSLESNGDVVHRNAWGKVSHHKDK